MGLSNINLSSNNVSTEIKTEKFTYKKKLKPYERREAWISRIFIWICMCIVIFPMLWVVVAAISPGDAFFSGELIPKSITLENFKELFKGTEVNFLGGLKNTLILCTSVAVVQIIMTSTAAYAFSRMRFKGRRNGLMSLLILQMFPGMMSVTAIYTYVYKHNLVGSYPALILLLAGGSAFNVWLLKNFIDGIPRELDEAATVDGATHFQIFWRIVMPLARPMLAVMFFFSFQGTYNEFVISSVILKTPESQTLVLQLQSLISGNFNQHWTLFAAASLIAALPLMIVFMLLQKFIQQGLVAGAVKG